MSLASVLGELHLYILDAAYLSKPWYRGRALRLARSAEKQLSRCDVDSAARIAKQVLGYMPKVLRKRLNYDERIRELLDDARRVCRDDMA